MRPVSVSSQSLLLQCPVKRHRGEPGHTRDTRAHTGTRLTQTNLTTIQTQYIHTLQAPKEAIDKILEQQILILNLPVNSDVMESLSHPKQASS